MAVLRTFMFKYICLIFVSMVLPSIAVTPQELINGGQLLYNAILANDFVKQKHAFQNADKLTILEYAREAAKKNKDAETTQYLTEQIIDHQTNCNRERLKKVLIIAVIATTSFSAGWFYRLKECAKLGSNTQCNELAFYKYSWLQCNQF